jgi:hypothetical protein
MGEVVRITLEGVEAEPGRVPAADVARLLHGYERALGRAAEARVRRRARTGRRGGAVETATRLIFRGIERGSLVAELELPTLTAEQALDLDEDHLGVFAAADVLALVEDPAGPADEWVVDALAILGDDLAIGDRYPALTIEVVRKDASARRATYTGETRRRLGERRRATGERPARHDSVVGTLVEADFQRHTARVVTSDQQAVTVTFGEGQSDEIQTALRRPGEFEGRIEYDPRSGAARSVELVRIVPPRSPAFLPASEEFWRHRTVDELAAEQGVGPVYDVDALVDREATEEELSAFLDALSS